MKSHRFDVLSFIFGLTFVALAAVTTFTKYAFNAHSLAWVGAGMLIVLGLAMVFGTRRRAADD